MATATAELDSFLVKFKYLWHRGHDVYLSVEAHAGQAKVTLQAGLGHHPPHPQYPPPFPQRNPNRRNGPARQRRRERRAADRQAAEIQKSAEEAPNQEDVNLNPAEDAENSVNYQNNTNENDNQEVAGNASFEKQDDIEIETNPAETAAANIPREISDEILIDPLVEAELVIVFGEVISEDKFDYEIFWSEMKEKLASGTSFFHYDGTYWVEKEQKNTTGFFQTVRLKDGFYRNFLYDLKNWPSGTKIVEIRNQSEDRL